MYLGTLGLGLTGDWHEADTGKGCSFQPSPARRLWIASSLSLLQNPSTECHVFLFDLIPQAAVI